MKKVVTIILCCIVAIGLSACGGTSGGASKTIPLTADNITEYLSFDGSFINGTFTEGTIMNWADATLELQTYPVQDGTFNNVEITLIASSDDSTFTYMNDLGNYWHLEGAEEGEDKEIKITVSVPFDGRFQKKYAVTCSNNTGKLGGDCDFEIVSASGEFKPND